MRVLFLGTTIFAVAVVIIMFNPLLKKQVYYSQFQQDKFVNEHFFKNKKKGIFVDIGAFDGIADSNSYFFEKNLGWNGICVEPVSFLFEKLRKNRTCICVDGCISDKEGTAQFLKVVSPDGSGHGWSGLIDKYDPIHMQRLQGLITEGSCITEITETKCYILEKILKENNINHIDYLSIDVEGAELAILKSIKFDALDIDVIDVENNYANEEIRNFLQSKDFVFITRIAVDDIFRKSSYITS